jgi:hypothetical protein
MKRRERTLFSLDYLFLRPVRRAAMLPTFRPGGACLLTVVGLPGDWCEPPPCGCDAAFIAAPRTTGHLRAFPRV